MAFLSVRHHDARNNQRDKEDGKSGAEPCDRTEQSKSGRPQFGCEAVQESDRCGGWQNADVATPYDRKHVLDRFRQSDGL